jgi:hypothetical protein
LKRPMMLVVGIDVAAAVHQVAVIDETESVRQ